MKTRTKKKSKSLLEAEEAMERLLKRVGYKGTGNSYRCEIPNYKIPNKIRTSDVVCGNGSKKEEIFYTGDEILGIATMHKSNAVPIRKDNKQAAIDIAQMRRS